MNEVRRIGMLLEKLNKREKHYLAGLIDETELENYVDHEILIYLEQKGIVIHE